MAARRLFIPGLSHHIRHRGNNRCHVFRDDEDRHIYLELLAKSAQKYQVDIYAFCLMTTHTHAVIEGHESDAVPRMMQSLGKGYVRYFNRRYRRTGTLWEGRYWAGLIGTDHYWLNCVRYVELNPVAARIVSCPDAYPWSTYRAHARGELNGLLAHHRLFTQLGTDSAERSARWAAMCGEPLSEADVAEIRRATRRGAIMGDGTGTD
jgi:putative transposase